MFRNIFGKGKMKARDWRMLCYLLVLVGILAWLKRGVLWQPRRTLTTEHYYIESSATDEQTRRVGAVGEILYSAYVDFVGALVPVTHTSEMEVRVYATEEEMRRYHSVGWAHAFYDAPCCYQYYDAGSPNPFHWFVHEGTHQLNREVAGLSLKKWLDEGLAVYFSTSRIENGELHAGKIDTNAYPLWWLDKVATSGELAADRENGSFIPLKTIVSGRGGPLLRTHFNLYYMHWWSLVHYLAEHEEGRHRPALAALLAEGGSLDAFEEHVGPTSRIQDEWYQHLLGLKQAHTGRYTPRVEVAPLTADSRPDNGGGG
jgi:hypothetical protein